MSERSETIAYCHACGSAMDVSAVAPFSSVECPTCQAETRVKREFGPYTLVSRHAVGGMSMVFIARDNTLNREVALKILSEEFSSDERRITAFEEEARITASFSHPHVVRVLRTGKAFERLYIAMELVPGGHFEHQIRERGKIPEIEMLPLAIQIAQGLKAAQAAGLIHRDVKPGNILLDADGHAKLVDFGLALVTQGGLAQASEVWATPYYVPPETIEGEPEDFRSDIYAFGATLYHALAGVPSCGEETMETATLRLAKQRVVPLSTVNPDLTVETCRIVELAMAYRPQARFSSYDELISQLENALKRLSSGGHSSPETSGTAVKRRAKEKRQTQTLLAGSGLILLGLIGVSVWWFNHQPLQTKPKPSVALGAPVSLEMDQGVSTEIARLYREARLSVEARDFPKAADEFMKLSENPAVQEPTRSWAAVESVISNFMASQSALARSQAQSAAAHIESLPEGDRLGQALTLALKQVQSIPAISSKNLDNSVKDSSHVMSWILAGIKNWDQGLLNEAAPYFQAAAVVTTKDQALLGTYQALARDYLEDYPLLTQKVFAAYPSTAEGCTAAVDELEGILKQLKTKGRARYNIRAWQLSLAKHGKSLLAPAAAEKPSAGSVE